MAEAVGVGEVFEAFCDEGWAEQHFWVAVKHAFCRGMIAAQNILAITS